MLNYSINFVEINTDMLWEFQKTILSKVIRENNCTDVKIMSHLWFIWNRDMYSIEPHNRKPYNFLIQLHSKFYPTFQESKLYAHSIFFCSKNFF